MNSRKRSGSGVFLMEMIMVCGFFLLCAAICIRVFIQADSMSRLAREMNQAVLAAESLADGWKVNGWESFSGNADGLQAETRINWNQNWTVIPAGGADKEAVQDCWYTAVITGQREACESGGQMESITIQVMRGNGHPRWKERNREEESQPLFSLETKRYVPAGRGDEVTRGGRK